MNTIIFYEKTGCVGNQQQKHSLTAWLRDSNKDNDFCLEVRDLLNTHWTQTELLSFFSGKPIKQWFNQSEPKVKSGEININYLSQQQAIDLMLSDPILICRPLLQYNSLKQSGYVDGPVLAALGIFLTPETDLQSCPMMDDEPDCFESNSGDAI
ncbi:MAG: nitrogenase-associated protein [gamma proteobacterium symbiont of Bathyaustriella thionipta]|nr:nitrogenase-associated protein [gamma proteobacterium symbiont of Bathyaustriella thionipta]MCU7950310.1 nitrogenase-associated protein [gamma proteobacterium symbiont of Bathyaustriella thionipta]MCU7952314.1 nitrogenase-associated protein [gamma proteobacterium symbiont of Bathyaustriella thionipta]MCU7956829.1 nitrogenase-associated protein [gamma proteobacterium symbiont of Bathyaustriella thionipta]MCU7966604.1 nitrogenase-associated protein [gamma proteobacterium symbiont of Bathyaustr